jgi:hypothetical protein
MSMHAPGARLEDRRAARPKKELAMKRQRNDRKKLVFEPGTIRELSRVDIERAAGGSLIPISDDEIDEPLVFQDPWGGGTSNPNC